METQRQKKINALLQQEITFLLQGAIRTQGVKNLVLSVSKVAVTVDLSQRLVTEDHSADVFAVLDEIEEMFGATAL